MTTNGPYDGTNILGKDMCKAELSMLFFEIVVSVGFHKKSYFES